MPLRVYASGSLVRRDEVDALHVTLLSRDIQPATPWPPESRPSDRDLLLGSHAALAIVHRDTMTEAIAEAEVALAYRIPVVWTGDAPSSVRRRPGLLVQDSLADALTLLEAWSDTILRPFPVPIPMDRETLWRWAIGQRETSQELPARVA